MRPDCDPGPTILPMVQASPPTGRPFGFVAGCKQPVAEQPRKQTQFASGMVRDTSDGKIDYTTIRVGPMLHRWAAHLTTNRAKYPDVAPGVANWTLADGMEEYVRARQSAARHFEQWLRGEQDEDHAAAILFNINLAEYVIDRMREAKQQESEVQV